MNKVARKPSQDPNQEKLRQNKANWNKSVSAFVNDLIHYKKLMNGWPSKFYQERSRIIQEIPADPATIIGSLSSDFQEIVNKGNSIIKEQIEYAKNRKQRQPKQLNLPLGQSGTSSDMSAEPTKPDLSQQLSLPAIANSSFEMIKVASLFEDKYDLASNASNPITRFITKILTPRIGFGEGARIRQLRRNLLDNCVKSFKDLKKLHKEIVGHSKKNIENSHNIMTDAFHHWNIVKNIFNAYIFLKGNGNPVEDVGGPIEKETDGLSPENNKGKSKNNKLKPTLKEVQVNETPEIVELSDHSKLLIKLIAQDYIKFAPQLPNSVKFNLVELHSILEKIDAATEEKKNEVYTNSNIEKIYTDTINNLNKALGTNGNSIKSIVESSSLTKDAQVGRWINKGLHQIFPGATSHPKLEIYKSVSLLKEDMNEIMDLLESGFDETKLNQAISKVHKEMVSLRTTIRSLYFAEKPEKAPTNFL